MLCEELERLEGEFDELITALEDPEISEAERRALEKAYEMMVKRINRHHLQGHSGGPCYEDEDELA